MSIKRIGWTRADRSAYAALLRQADDHCVILETLQTETTTVIALVRLEREQRSLARQSAREELDSDMLDDDTNLFEEDDHAATDLAAA